MPRKAKIKQLPAEIRSWIDQQLVERNFQGYEAFTAEANAKLAGLGYEVRFGKTSAHRYGSSLERRLQAIKDSTEAARLIAIAAPDDADLRGAATISLVQTELMSMLVDARESENEEDPGERLKILARVGKTAADLTRASVNQKKHEFEVRRRSQAAADAAAQIAKKGGLSASGIDAIRRTILGIAETPRAQKP